MRFASLRYALAFALVASWSPVASASFLTCTETVNTYSSVEVESFPTQLSYDLTVTEAWCVYCTWQPANDWCHVLCQGTDGGPTGTYSVVESESDDVLASFSKAPIPWNPAPQFALTNGASATTNITFVLQSYADCAQRAALAGVLPDEATGSIVIPDAYRVTWSNVGAPPYYAECSAQVTCKPPLGRTRTIGYFRTHPDAVQDCLATPIELGFLTVTDATAALGLLNTNPAQYDGGVKRSGLDHARILLGRQLLAAICNERVFGSSPADGLIAAAVGALGTGTCANLNSLQGQLDAFNNSGDTGENWFGKAAPGTYPDPTPRTAVSCR